MSADEHLNMAQFSPDTANYGGTAHDYGRVDRGDDYVTRNEPHDTEMSARNTTDEYMQGEGGWVSRGAQSMNERPVETWHDKSGRPVNTFHSIFIPNVNSIRPTN